MKRKNAAYLWIAATLYVVFGVLSALTLLFEQNRQDTWLRVVLIFLCILTAVCVIRRLRLGRYLGYLLATLTVVLFVLNWIQYLASLSWHLALTTQSIIQVLLSLVPIFMLVTPAVIVHIVNWLDERQRS